MLLLVQNRILTYNREQTTLTAAVAPAGTTLTVKGINASAWADNDWLILGEIGAQNAEVLQVNGAVSNGTSLTVDNAGSGGARYAHAVDEPVYRIDYNQIKFYHATGTDSSASSLLATVSLQPENIETRYEDTAHTTGYGFARFYNSATTSLSPFSDAIPYLGQSQRSLYRMIQKVRSLCNEQDDQFLSDSEIVSAINDKQRDILNERLWTFNEVERSQSSINSQFAYDIQEDIKTTYSIRFRSQPIARISESRWDMVHWGTSQSSSYPTHVSVWNNQMRFFPRPDSSANADQLDGAITASDTSITVDDASGFTLSDYYRFQIDDEIIYATGVSSLDENEFTGCLRGREGTTAASHLDNAVVTELDIVAMGQGVATDLRLPNDETVVPEPIVICYGVAADFCKGKLHRETVGDRYEIRYAEGMKNLAYRFNRAFIGQMGRIKDSREVVSDNGIFRDPNDYPTNVVAP